MGYRSIRLVFWGVKRRIMCVFLIGFFGPEIKCQKKSRGGSECKYRNPVIHILILENLYNSANPTTSRITAASKTFLPAVWVNSSVI